jgi:hypothetical protein
MAWDAVLGKGECCPASVPEPVQAPMIIDITIPPDVARTIEFRIFIGPGNTMVINWGDGTTESFTSSDPPVASIYPHTYASSGSYKIKFNGAIVQFGSGENTFVGAEFIQGVEQWGDVLPLYMVGAFNGARNLTYLPPTISAVIDMSSMLQGCTSFNGDITRWGTGITKYMKYMFNGATSFNQNLSGWNAANVLDATGMFCGCPLDGQIAYYPRNLADPASVGC